MKLFIKRVVFFLIPIYPILLFSMCILLFDSFKIFSYYDDYYSDISIMPNREMICTKIYNQHKKTEKFNSFILGNSRSNAYKCNTWKQFLNENARVFHFDSSGESVWGITSKLQYIDEGGADIDNVLIVLDGSTLLKTKNRTELYNAITMPCISKESIYNYYATYIRTSLDISFFFKIGNHFLKNYSSSLPQKNHGNPINCDFWYCYDDQIAIDSIAYYKRRIEQGVFYKRSEKSQVENLQLSELAVQQLNQIKDMFNKHNTNYNIIISPLYSEVTMGKDCLNNLYNIFGKNNVHDFSGKNNFTKSINNWYEQHHYKASIANKIMSTIYSVPK